MNVIQRPSPESSPLGNAIRAAYRAGQEDEALAPIVKVDAAGRPIGRIGRGDSVIFYDIRGEREIEITQSLTDPDFPHFPVEKDLDLSFVTMIEYAPHLLVRAAFPKDGTIASTLAEVLSRAGCRVVKVAESEKAAHIGFFMNGKSEAVFPGEERLIIPSPEGLVNYDERPDMSAALVADAVLHKMKDPLVRLVIANFANVDVVGHIENKAAAIRAVETVDHELGRIVAEAGTLGMTLMVTADHGTVEEWLYPDGTINTGHTSNPVPFVFADFSSGNPTAAGAPDFARGATSAAKAPPLTRAVSLRERGELADVAPTLLEVLAIPVPVEMTGRSLLGGGGAGGGSEKRAVLIILDGWGLGENSRGNLIASSSTPNFDALWARFPRSVLDSSGEAVGMPAGTVGNSEAGHLHLGAGRRVLLDRVRIDAGIRDGSFASNPAFRWAMDNARRGRRPLHLMGIVSHYSSHGTIDHLFGLLELAKAGGVPEVFIHGFIGRRGERPESGAVYVEMVEDRCRALGIGRVATVLGRYWSLDREGNWDRLEKAYRALIYGEGTRVRG